MNNNVTKGLLFCLIISISIITYAQQEVMLDIKNNDESEYAMIDIGLSDKQRSDINEMLNNILANEFTLYVKTLNYHWRVRGHHFGPLHTLFREQYEELFKIIDEVAERIRALGGESQATLTKYLQLTTLKEEPDERPDDMGMIRHLLVDHETVIKQLRQIIDQIDAIGDTGTSNFLQEIMVDHEKMAWMLRAHLEK